MSVSVVLTVTVAILSSATTLGAVWLSARLGRQRVPDKEQYRKWLSVFDRPAFKGPYNFRTDLPPFEKAISLVLQAVDTGNVYNRAGNELTELRGIGKAQLHQAALREQMDDVANRLQKVRALVRKQMREQMAGDVRLSYTDLAQSIDAERDAIITSMNEKWAAFGFRGLPIPTSLNNEYEYMHEE